MATAILTDFKVYQNELQAGLWEGVSENIDAFNSVSRNAIRLVQESKKGQYDKEAIFTLISDIISRRDSTSTSAANAVKPAQDELIAVKLDRKIGPIELTLDSIRKIGEDQATVSFILGQQIGQSKAKDMLNTAIIAVEAAIEGVAALNYDVTSLSTKTLTTEYLVSTLAKMGDASDNVVAWLMHSKPYFDLTKEQISAKVVNVADRVIYEASPVTLNRPVIVSDISSLINEVSGSTTTYNVLGLTTNGVVVTESEQSEVISEVVTGLENLVLRLQGEYAVNVGCKGYKWDTTGGGVNPTTASLGTTTNWDQVMTSIKDLAGVRCLCQ